jgi:hypothetical protein
MRRAMSVRTNPIDRHFLLMGIVQQSYKRRDEPTMRRICRETGQLHLREFETIAPALKREMGGFMPRVPTFQLLAILLAKDGDLEGAIQVCDQALRWEIRDGTQRGFDVRRERLRKQLAALRGS